MFRLANFSSHLYGIFPACPATSSAAPLTTAAVPSSNSGAKPNVTATISTNNTSSSNTSHQAALPLLSSPKSSSVSSTPDPQQQKQQAQLSQGQQGQQQQPQSRILNPNQVLPPSYPYQLQQQRQQPLTLPPPIAIPGMSQVVDANTNVMLDGRKSFVPVLQQQQPDGRTIIAYQWIQLPVGIAVNMTGANTPTPMFKAPVLP